LFEQTWSLCGLRSEYNSSSAANTTQAKHLADRQSTIQRRRALVQLTGVLHESTFELCIASFGRRFSVQSESGTHPIASIAARPEI